MNKLSIQLSLLSLLPAISFAEELVIDDLNNTQMIRFELDNDFFFNDDSQFSNGWSLQYHSKVYENWEETDAPGFVKSIANYVPGLDTENKFTRYGHGIGQNMVTSGDLSLDEPPEGDMPYAGTLTYSFNWQAFSQTEMTVFQMTLGVMGKASFAKEFQKFVHNDLGRGDDPQGWEDQRDDEPIVNIAYQRGWRLMSFGEYDNAWGGQFAIAPSLHLGNLYTGADVAAAFRFGWNIQKGFSAYPAIPGRGFYQSSFLPKTSKASPHGFEIILGAKAQAFGYSVIYDGSEITNDDREVDRKDYVVSGIFGINYHYYSKYSLRFYLFTSSDLIEEDSLPITINSDDQTEPDNSYGTLVFEYHF